MADVKQIEVNGVTYDIHDATARAEIANLQQSVSQLEFKGLLDNSSDLNDLRETGIYGTTGTAPLNAPTTDSTYDTVITLYPGRTQLYISHVKGIYHRKGTGNPSVGQVGRHYIFESDLEALYPKYYGSPGNLNNMGGKFGICTVSNTTINRPPGEIWGVCLCINGQQLAFGFTGSTALYTRRSSDNGSTGTNGVKFSGTQLSG